MRILSYTNLLLLAKPGKFAVNRVEYTVSQEILDYLRANLPVSGECLFGDSRLLAFFEPKGISPGSITMFQPGGPPDPGIVISPNPDTIPAPAPV